MALQPRSQNGAPNIEGATPIETGFTYAQASEFFGQNNPIKDAERAERKRKAGEMLTTVADGLGIPHPYKEEM